MNIDTDKFSARLRLRAVDVQSERLLVANLLGSDQEQDLTDPPNCSGVGRIRHFRRATSPGWPSNPLPIDPASAALSLPRLDMLQAQVFQNAACNWRCWYCFVPFNLLSGDAKRGTWVTADELVAGYMDQTDPPLVIDLSGGQPDLAPEWVPWMIRALTRRGLAGKVYLWSDDNLSNDYFWRYLSDEDIYLVANCPWYGKVGCFKGFDERSFAFNTTADPSLFARQFDLIGRLIALGLDCYAYCTFTTSAGDGVDVAIAGFLDRLQRVHENLPLRTVPLEVVMYGPVHQRMNTPRYEALKYQWKAIEVWESELSRRYSSQLRALPINEVPLR